MSDNILVQLQLSDRSIELLDNGGFENWTGANIDDWTIYTTGTSTVTKETGILRPRTAGANAVRLTYDATPGKASIFQTKTAIKESYYYLSFWYRCEEYSSTQTFSLLIRDSAKNVYLQDDGTWSSNRHYFIIPSCDNWSLYERKFLTHPDYTDYYINLGSDNTVTAKYVIVDDIEIKLDTTFAAMSATSYNGAQYVADILNSNINISTGYAERGIFRGSGYDLKLSDPTTTIGGVNYRHYLDILSDPATGRVCGANAIARNASGNVIDRGIITDINTAYDEIGFTISQSFGELRKENKTPPVISQDMFPDAPYTSVGKHINHFSGSFLVNPVTGDGKGERNFLRCYRICDCSGVNPSRYLIGKSIQDIVVFSGTRDFQHVFDPDGNEISATKCTLVTATAATGAGQYSEIYLDFSVGCHEYVDIHFKYSVCGAETMIEEIGELLFPSWKYDLTDVSGWLLGRNYNTLTGGYQYHSDPHFVVNCETNYLEILQNICTTFNFSYVVSTDRKIKFKIFDYNAPWSSSETTTINDAMAESFEFIPEQSAKYDTIINRINSRFGFDGTGSYHKDYTFDMKESQHAFGFTNIESYNMPHFAADLAVSKRLAWATAKNMMIESFLPKKIYTFRVFSVDDIFSGTNTVYDILEPFKILKFKHSIFSDTDYHYMRITKVSLEIPDNTAVVEFVDVTDISIIDGNATLLLQSTSEDNNLTILDGAPNGWHLLYNNGSGVEHSTDYPLFSKTSLQSLTATPDLQVGPFAFYSDLHIFAALAANGYASSTMSLWARFDVLGIQESIVAQHVDATHYWSLFRTAANKIRLYVYDAGVVLDITTTTSVVAGKWNHIVFHRTDSDIGLYYNGVQEAHSAAGLNTIFSKAFSLFSDGNSGNYMSGNLQDVRFELSSTGITERVTGWFDLSPNVGLTDTYVVPWGLHSAYWKKYWNPTI